MTATPRHVPATGQTHVAFGWLLLAAIAGLVLALPVPLAWTMSLGWIYGTAGLLGFLAHMSSASRDGLHLRRTPCAESSMNVKSVLNACELEIDLFCRGMRVPADVSLEGARGVSRTRAGLGSVARCLA